VSLVPVVSNAQVATFQKTYGTLLSPDHGNLLQRTDDKGYIIAGTSKHHQGASKFGFFLTKTDSLYNLQWTKSFSAAMNTYTVGVVQMRDRGY
jgi:hypothetical protein